MTTVTVTSRPTYVTVSNSTSSVTVTNRKSTVEIARVGTQGPPGPQGSGLELAGRVPTRGALPVLTPADAGKAYLVEADGLLYVWDGSQWPPTGAAFTGPRGKDGQIRFTGHGPPGVIVGAEPGDTYMDLDTGDIYKLT